MAKYLTDELPDDHEVDAIERALTAAAALVMRLESADGPWRPEYECLRWALEGFHSFDLDGRNGASIGHGLTDAQLDLLRKLRVDGPLPYADDMAPLKREYMHWADPPHEKPRRIAVSDRGLYLLAGLDAEAAQ